MYAPTTICGAAREEEKTSSGQAPNFPKHLIEVPGTNGEWTLWRCVALRGAGFPAGRALDLADEAVAEAADRLIQAEADAISEKRKIRKLLDSRLDELRARGEWEIREKREPLLRARHAVEKDKPAAAPDEPEIHSRLQSHANAVAAVKTLRSELENCINASAARTTERIREICRDPLFQEAVMWQNRRLFHTVLKKCAERSPADKASNWKWRQREELVASYVQRYSVKNDTIGYFGPVGWANFTGLPGYVEAIPGPGLVASRQIYLESWGVDRLAATLAKNPALRRWIIPRLTPFARITDGALHLPGKAPLEMAPHHLMLLSRCDGITPTIDLASGLLRDGGSGFASEREILLLLERFRTLDLIAWEFPIPVTPKADEALGLMVKHIRDGKVRETCLKPLHELQAAADEVRRSVGCVEKLDSALANLENTFTRLTQLPAVRSGGQTYVGRTLLYEDCQRDVEVSLGSSLLEELARPLALILTSARWYTHTIATRCERVFERIYAELASETGSNAVDATRFWYRFQPFLLGAEENVLTASLAEFQQKWMDILKPANQRQPLLYTVTELRDKVERAFFAPSPGWQMARYQSPDIMIAAPSADAIREGQSHFVLGELHASLNTINQCLFVNQHPDPELPGQWIERDLPEPMVARLAPKDWPKLTTRTQIAYISPKDCRLIVSYGSSGVLGERAVPLSNFIVEKRNGRLVVSEPERNLRFEIIEFFADALSYLLNDGFRLLPRVPHLPRISIDRLVVVRETYSIQASEVTFAAEPMPAARFLGVRRWARAQNMPRFLFVKVPVEKKPFYVDLDSPVYVDLFCKNVHRTQESSLADTLVVITEMLPLPQDSWLVDRAQRHFTSELRMVAVDQAGRNSRSASEAEVGNRQEPAAE